ncbi:MAG: tRNA modification GTPase [Bacteroidales bacterium]|nr:tRNA modification GTPase [Bacteroidales bacterium]
MKIKILFCILFLSAECSFGQIIFEKGYLITNENQKIECLIKNNDWDLSPTMIKYKLIDNEDIKTGNISTIREFGIYGYSRYIKATVKIDRSSTKLSDLSQSRNAIWNQEQLFLKVLVQGKANLYCYKERNFTKFFYSLTDTLIQQLMFKEYSVNSHQMATNNDFRQQLMREVSCENTPLTTIEKINYDQNELERYFEKYNACEKNSIATTNTKKKLGKFNLRITPGLNYSSLSLGDGNAIKTKKYFKNEPDFRFGLEAEYILPFNKNKWGVTFEPSYYYFKGKNPLSTSFKIVKFSSLYFSIGVRHYFFLNNTNKIFINGIINSITRIDLNSQISSIIGTLYIRHKPNLAFGVGFEYRNLSAEFRYYTNQGALKYRSDWSFEYSNISFIIGYKLLRTGDRK